MLVSPCSFNWFTIQCGWPRKASRGRSASYAPPSFLTPIVRVISEDLAGHFDVRTQWPNCASLKEIRDQGDCGSCWASGAIKHMTDRICIASNGIKNVHISAEELVACCSDCGYGCDGDLPDITWKYFQQTDLVTGGNYNSNQGYQPYTILTCDHQYVNSIIQGGPKVTIPKKIEYLSYGLS